MRSALRWKKELLSHLTKLRHWPFHIFHVENLWLKLDCQQVKQKGALLSNRSSALLKLGGRSFISTIMKMRWLISKKSFLRKLETNVGFNFFFKRHDPIVQLSRNYHDAPIGETLCLFNDAAYLTIAINMGKAASLLGLKMDDMVQVDFS